MGYIKKFEEFINEGLDRLSIDSDINSLIDSFKEESGGDKMKMQKFMVEYINNNLDEMKFIEYLEPKMEQEIYTTLDNRQPYIHDDDVDDDDGTPIDAYIMNNKIGSIELFDLKLSSEDVDEVESGFEKFGMDITWDGKTDNFEFTAFYGELDMLSTPLGKKVEDLFYKTLEKQKDEYIKTQL